MSSSLSEKARPSSTRSASRRSLPIRRKRLSVSASSGGGSISRPDASQARERAVYFQA